jgi:peroxiredoxin
VISVGSRAPVFSLPAGGGGVVSLDDLVDGPVPAPAVLLVFFKVDCPTCAITFPLVGELAAFLDGRVPVVAIAQDRTAPASAWVREQGFGGLVASDAYGRHRVARAYRVDTLPTLVLVGADRGVRLAFEGWDRERYNDLVLQAASAAGLAGADGDGGAGAGGAALPLSSAGDGRPRSQPGCWARSRSR